MTEDILILIVFYLIGMFTMAKFVWGRLTEKAYEFQKDMYWGRLLGQKRYYVVMKSAAIICMIGMTLGVITVLCSK